MNPSLPLLRCISVLAAFLSLPLQSSAKTGEPQTASANIVLVENKGQIIDQFNQPRTDVDFKLGLGSMNVFLGDGQLHYQWYKSKTVEVSPTDNNYSSAKEAFREQHKNGVQVDAYRMDVVLVGANKNARIIKEEKQSYFESYYLPQYTGSASSFSKVIYQDIYPRIDWVIYTKDGQLKYDFVVHPGGNPKDIKLKYSGATSLKMENGSVTAHTSYGSVTEQKPYSYDAVTKKEVPSAFVLHANTLSFNIAAETGNDIVIDPVLDWATYYGSTGGDLVGDVVTDASGGIYMCGWTQSTSNMATTGAHQTTMSGSYDAFVVKMNNSTTRAWATYCGGPDQDWLYNAAIDPSGNLYFSGETNSSSGIATTGAHQTTIGGAFDVMLVKFSSTGSRIWGTYVGGNGDDDSHVTCDGSGNVYVSGETWSSNGIATTGAHQTSWAGARDGFLIKLSGAGGRQWGTYLGGAATDAVLNAACDASNNVIVVGVTISSSGISSTGAHQSSIGSLSDYDGFVSKFSSTGSMLWSTYYGGSDGDLAHDVACDASNNIYISGYTTSTAGIATTGTHQPTKSTDRDGLIAKFNSSGVRQWGTYFGGNASDDCAGIVLYNGRIYVSGVTSSTNVATTNAYKTSLGGTWDALLGEFDQANGTLKWSSYYGGPSFEYPWAALSGGNGGVMWGTGGNMHVSSIGKLYHVGNTNSSSGIATTGTYQTSLLGSHNGYLTCWNLVDTLVSINQPFYDTALCTGDTFRLYYTVSASFKTGNTFTVQLSNSTGSFAAPTTVGTASATTGGSILVTIPNTVATGTGYRLRIVASNPSRTSEDNGVNIKIGSRPNVFASVAGFICEGGTLTLNASSSSSGTIAYAWSGPLSFSSTSQNPSLSPATLSMSGNYVVTATRDGCSASDIVGVTVEPTPSVVAGSNSPVCPNNPLTLSASSATSGVTYSWTGPNSFTSAAQNPTVSTSATSLMAGTYSVTATKNNCISAPSTTTVIVAITTPTPIAAANDPICSNTTLNLTASAIPGATYSWSGPAGFTSGLQNPTISKVQLSQSGKYQVTATVNNCTSLPGEVNVVIIPGPSMGGYVSPNDTICQGFTATFVGFSQNHGTNPTYQWYKNFAPIPGATALIYATSNLVTGDKIYCLVTVPGLCGAPVDATTDTFDMVVLPVITIPAVTITADPGLAINPDQQVTFTATVAHGGTTPKYQWYKNGVILPGARYATLVTQGLFFGDKISVDIISEDPCAENKSASDTVTIGHPTGIENKGSAGALKLYPNPNKGSFTVAGIRASQVEVEIMNAIGQIVYHNQVKQVAGQLSINTQLASGVYLLRLANGDNLNQTFKFTITE